MLKTGSSKIIADKIMSKDSKVGLANGLMSKTAMKKQVKKSVSDINDKSK